MVFQLNIEDLLNKRKVESNRIEFKKGWNPSDIYQTICAFANDYENIGGGYILVGVEQDENGVARRPVKGLPLNEIDNIMKEMVGYDAKIKPSYVTRVEAEEVDGRHILAIWAPARNNRPYSVPENVVAKHVSNVKYYIRSKSSSIEAKGEILRELFDLANNTPFDERGNPHITIDDISPVLVYDHLKKIGSKLIESFNPKHLIETLEAMELLIGPTEDRLIKNVAAMMFCEHPEKFFPVTQVDIVIFPEGSIENPDLLIEAPKITGPVPKMIQDALSYLRTNVIKQKIVKPTDKEESIKTFNYPYQAFEEIISNCLYHRDYQMREPVEITVEPTHIDVLSFGGPDRSISAKDIKEAKKLKARRYRNRRLGDFLKELDLTEGRSTGIPTIQKALRENGSSSAVIETDDDRTYFLMTIPCREGFEDVEIIEQTIKSHSILKELGQVSDDLLVQVEDAVNKSIIADKSQLGQVIEETLVQVGANSSFRKNPLPIVKAIINTLTMLYHGEQMASQLYDASGLNTSKDYKRRILYPLTKQSLIEMTNPEKPSSRLQSYRLTSLGLNLFCGA